MKLGEDAGEPTLFGPVMQALESRERRLHPVPVDRILENVPQHEVFQRVPTLWEEIDARVWAARYAAREAGEAVAIAADAGLDLATLHIIAHATVRREGAVLVPAFGPPRWLAKRLKADELAALLRCLNECRLRESEATRISEPAALDIISALAVVGPEEAAEVVAHLDYAAVVEVLRIAAKLAANDDARH